MKITTTSRLAPLALGVVLAAGALAACADEPQAIDPAGTGSTSVVGSTTGPGGPGSGGGGDGGNGSGPSGPGGTQSGPSGGPSAEEMFVNTVYPLLAAPTESGG